MKVENFSNSHVHAVIRGEGLEEGWLLTSFMGPLIQAKGLIYGIFCPKSTKILGDHDT